MTEYTKNPKNIPLSKNDEDPMKTPRKTYNIENDYLFFTEKTNTRFKTKENNHFTNKITRIKKFFDTTTRQKLKTTPDYKIYGNIIREVKAVDSVQNPLNDEAKLYATINQLRGNIKNTLSTIMTSKSQQTQSKNVLLEGKSLQLRSNKKVLQKKSQQTSQRITVRGPNPFIFKTYPIYSSSYKSLVTDSRAKPTFKQNQNELTIQTVLFPSDWTPYIHNLPRYDFNLRPVSNKFDLKSPDYIYGLLLYSMLCFLGLLTCVVVWMCACKLYTRKLKVFNRPTKRIQRLKILTQIFASLTIIVGVCGIVGVMASHMRFVILKQKFVYPALRNFTRFKEKVKKFNQEFHQKGSEIQKKIQTLSKTTAIIEKQFQLPYLAHLNRTVGTAMKGGRDSLGKIDNKLMQLKKIKNLTKSLLLLEWLFISFETLFWLTVIALPAAMIMIFYKYTRRRVRLMVYVLIPMQVIIVVSFVTAAYTLPLLLMAADMCFDFVEAVTTHNPFNRILSNYTVNYYITCQNSSAAMKKIAAESDKILNYLQNVVSAMANTPKAYVDIQLLREETRYIYNFGVALTKCNSTRNAFRYFADSFCNKCLTGWTIQTAGLLSTGILLTLTVIAHCRLRRVQKAILCVKIHRPKISQPLVPFHYFRKFCDCISKHTTNAKTSNETKSKKREIIKAIKLKELDSKVKYYSHCGVAKIRRIYSNVNKSGMSTITITTKVKESMNSFKTSISSVSSKEEKGRPEPEIKKKAEDRTVIFKDTALWPMKKSKFYFNQNKVAVDETKIKETKPSSSSDTSQNSKSINVNRKSTAEKNIDKERAKPKREKKEKKSTPTLLQNRKTNKKIVVTKSNEEENFKDKFHQYECKCGPIKIPTIYTKFTAMKTTVEDSVSKSPKSMVTKNIERLRAYTKKGTQENTKAEFLEIKKEIEPTVLKMKKKGKNKSERDDSFCKCGLIKIPVIHTTVQNNVAKRPTLAMKPKLSKPTSKLAVKTTKDKITIKPIGEKRKPVTVKNKQTIARKNMFEQPNAYCECGIIKLPKIHSYQNKTQIDPSKMKAVDRKNQITLTRDIQTQQKKSEPGNIEFMGRGDQKKSPVKRKITNLRSSRKTASKIKKQFGNNKSVKLKKGPEEVIVSNDTIEVQSHREPSITVSYKEFSPKFRTRRLPWTKRKAKDNYKAFYLPESPVTKTVSIRIRRLNNRRRKRKLFTKYDWKKWLWFQHLGQNPLLN